MKYLKMCDKIVMLPINSTRKRTFNMRKNLWQTVTTEDMSSIKSSRKAIYTINLQFSNLWFGDKSI